MGFCGKSIMIESALKVETRNGKYCYKKGNYWYVFGNHFPNKWTQILNAFNYWDEIEKRQLRCNERNDKDMFIKNKYNKIK